MTAAVPLVERLAEVAAEAFDEWLFRMHGVTSSCDHAAEGRGIAEALLPVVEQAVAEARGEALREAADARPEWQETLNREDDRHFATGSSHGAGPDVACDVFETFLRDRADAIATTEGAP